MEDLFSLEDMEKKNTFQFLLDRQENCKHFNDLSSTGMSFGGVSSALTSKSELTG